MNFERERASANLAQMVLMVFEVALRHREDNVAEHLLCALEELARTESVCRATLDRAYVLIGRSDMRQ